MPVNNVKKQGQIQYNLQTFSEIFSPSIREARSSYGRVRADAGEREREDAVSENFVAALKYDYENFRKYKKI